jgi:glyoxylase-like metal-dependent hydrolase (beta-lactamase superfamily II)
VEHNDGTTVIDPGPAIPKHIGAIIAALRRPLVRILVTHAHSDHWSGLSMLLALSRAPVFAYSPNLDGSFVPDEQLEDGGQVGPFTAIHTPGHAHDHLCFALVDGTLFSGDTVMQWSSTMVSPPLGRMGDYIKSLERLQQRPDRIMLPGHGPAVTHPRERVGELIERRRSREAAIVTALDQQLSLDALMDRIYANLDENLRPFALRNLRAHLIKLAEEGRIEGSDSGWRLTGVYSGLFAR